MIWASIIDLVGGFFQNKAKLSEAKTMARIENSNTLLSGWTDEYLVIVWSYPMVSLFIPGLEAHTVAGFEKLSSLPEWYVGGFISISFAVFGINKLFKYKGK